MALNFPNSPQTNDTVTFNGKVYTWDGEKWIVTTPISKADVGLGDVSNFGIASDTEAEAGTANDKYMTPLRTAEAISVLSPTPNDGQLTVEGSNGLSGTGTFTSDQGTNATITLSHADTSTQANVDNSANANLIKSMTFDDYGHVTEVTSGVEMGLANVIYLTTTLATGDWSGTDPVTAEKTVSGILDTDKPLIDIDLSSVAFANVEAKQTEYAKIFRVAATEANYITFFALEAPTEELVIQIKVVR